MVIPLLKYLKATSIEKKEKLKEKELELPRKYNLKSGNPFK